MTENKYLTSLIYQITCKDQTIKEIYIGSTTQFYSRRRSHKNKCKTGNSKLYKFIRDNHGWDNFNMHRVEYFRCNTRKELEAREGEMVSIHNATLNKKKPGRSIQQYRLDTKHIRNKKCMCVCGLEYTTQHRASHFNTTRHENRMNQLQD